MPEQVKVTGAAAVKTFHKSFRDRVSRRLWFLEAEGLCALACRQTGLADLGDPPVQKPLARLVDSLENEADLHPLGRFLMREHLLGLLKMRLRLARAWRSGTETGTSLIERPVFITGMPRSGSTFLHELLAQDHDSRSPRVWEVMFPLPAPEPLRTRREPRISRAAACLWWFRRLAPQADAVYPLRAQTPHECVAIHSYTFYSEEFISTCRVPSYEQFLRSTGFSEAYAWEKRFLQHLQSRCPARQWILKSPDHLCALDELFAVFPDAFIIHTHRNPLEVLKSSIQLTKTLQGLFSRENDADELRRHETKALAERMERSICFRDSHPELSDRFLDVSYTELISDPMAVVRRIYRHLGRPLSETTVQKMSKLTTKRSRYQRRRDPTLAELGLDPTAEARRFQGYCQRFGVPCRQPAVS